MTYLQSRSRDRHDVLTWQADVAFVGGEPGGAAAGVPNAGAVLHPGPALGVLHTREAEQRRCTGGERGGEGERRREGERERMGKGASAGLRANSPLFV